MQIKVRVPELSMRRVVNQGGRLPGLSNRGRACKGGGPRPSGRGRTWRNWYTQQTLTIGVPVGKPAVQNRSNSGKAKGARREAGFDANPEPSPGSLPQGSVRGRCRDWTGGACSLRETFAGIRLAMAKGQSSPRTLCPCGGGGESRSGMKICLPKGNTGSIPVVRTTFLRR